MLPAIHLLSAMKFNLFATEHTADFLLLHDLEKVYKISTKKSPNVSELLDNDETTSSSASRPGSPMGTQRMVFSSAGKRWTQSIRL